MEKTKDSDLFLLEKQLWAGSCHRIMGLDEVGRGCLAGPVVAAGVILPKDFSVRGIRDSKTLTTSQRLHFDKIIKEEALFWIIREGSVQLIEQLNILWASIDTMRRCAEADGAAPDYLLIDGNRYTDSFIPYSCVVGGDNKSVSIAAASIIAKVYRDNLMETLGTRYKEFNWQQNAGYPTAEHRKALVKNGYTVHHRRNFKLGTDKIYRNAE